MFLFIFLPVTLIGYEILARFGRRTVIGWLALASIAFYSYWDWHFVFVLLGSMLMNFTISRIIAASSAQSSKKLWLIVGIAGNLGALCYYKYLFHILDFFTSVRWTHHAWAQLALPLGISFFTFTQIGYLIDLQQGLAGPQNIVEYALFVTFFPHLIAGPILHHKEMMPQFLADRDPHLRMDDMLVGVCWFVLGFAKKCIIADYFGPQADAAFASGAHLALPGAWLGVVLYSLQLYFDFSGYSDMAIGLARMFSIQFPMNFNSPYKSTNIIDYWSRFHMTLTRYLTLYLYNPISLAVSRRRLQAGKKVSQKAARTPSGFATMIAFPTIVTFFLAGIWHGAGMQYLIFGLLHGVYLTVNHAFRLYRGQIAERKPRTQLMTAASVLLTYVSVIVAQVFFRAANTHAAIQYLGGMIGLHGVSWHGPELAKLNVLVAAAGLAIVWFCPNTQQILSQADSRITESNWTWLSWKPTWQWSVAIGLLFFISVLCIQNSATFLYFQF
jgi:D-alanyl-lipoteichoic acid acyltransferase DltB (MBOAT superfamily)